MKYLVPIWRLLISIAVALVCVYQYETDRLVKDQIRLIMAGQQELAIATGHQGRMIIGIIKWMGQHQELLQREKDTL